MSSSLHLWLPTYCRVVFSQLAVFLQVKATSLLADENLELKHEAQEQAKLLKTLQEKVAALESASQQSDDAERQLRTVQGELQDAHRQLGQERARAAAAAKEADSAQGALKVAMTSRFYCFC